MSGETVYVNDNPIGETEVYHADKHHVTTLRRWRDRYVRETTAEEAREDGLRPCKNCFPTEAGRVCPACGHEGTTANDMGQQSCPNVDCRVDLFIKEGSDV